MERITEKLFSLQDLKYRDFQAKLIPGISPENVIGVRTPELRKLAKELIRSGDAEQFLTELPHRYFDEDQLHAFIISEVKEYETAIELTETFLPYINNWATCDQLSPKVFKKNREKLIDRAKAWTISGRTYTVRFGIGILMNHFLDDEFKPEYPELVSKLRSEEYYVNMMIAWYFATALAKQYDCAVKYLENGVLPVWVHNKTIQKARESYRITPDQKEYLKTLKRTGK